MAASIGSEFGAPLQVVLEATPAKTGFLYVDSKLFAMLQKSLRYKNNNSDNLMVNEPQDFLLRRKFVCRMNGSKPKIVYSQI